MTDRHAIFVVHSNRKTWHAALYREIQAIARELNVRTSEYRDWMWMTGDGVSTSHAERRIRDSFRGTYEIDGLGLTSIKENGMGHEHFLRGGYFNPRPQRLNHSDLDHLLSLARAVVLVEDEHDQMTSGMKEEVKLLSKLSVRKVNVRLVRSWVNLESESMFPFQAAEPRKAASGSGDPTLPRNRYTTCVRKRTSAKPCFQVLDLKLLKLVLALSIEDDRHAGEWRTSTAEQERFEQFSPIRLRGDIHNRLHAPRRLVSITEGFAELMRSDDFYVRRGAGLAILCTHNARLVSQAARRAASDMVRVTEYSDMLDEFALFMWHTRGLKWGAVIQEIKRMSGFGVKFADGGHVDGAEPATG